MKEYKRIGKPYGLLFGKSGHVKKIYGIDPICKCHALYRRDSESKVFYCEKCHYPLFSALAGPGNDRRLFFSADKIPGDKILVKWE